MEWIVHNASWGCGRPRSRWREEQDTHLKSWPVAVLIHDKWKKEMEPMP